MLHTRGWIRHTPCKSPRPRSSDLTSISATHESIFAVDGFIYMVIQGIRPADVVPAQATVSTRPISHQAILSFATILFGTEHHQGGILRQGYIMYGDALRQPQSGTIGRNTAHQRRRHRFRCCAGRRRASAPFWPA